MFHVDWEVLGLERGMPNLDGMRETNSFKGNASGQSLGVEAANGRVWLRKY